MISSSIGRPQNRVQDIANLQRNDDEKSTSGPEALAAKSSSASQTPMFSNTSFGDSSALRDSVLARSSAPSTNSSTDDVQSVFEEQFLALATDKEAFHSTFEDAFGGNYDVDAAEGIRQQTLAGDFSWMPSVEFVSAEVLGDGIGAYDAANDRILLNSDFKGTTQLANIFTEEVGHALDARLNTSDTAGDEGELFQMLIAGEKPGATRRQEMLNDNDHGSIVVDGETVKVEFGWNPFKAVVDFVRDEIIEPVVEFVQDEIIEPIVDNVIEPIVDNVVTPLFNFGGNLFNIASDIVKFPFDAGKLILEGAINTGSALLSGNLSAAWGALAGTFSNVGTAVVGQIVDTAVLSASAAVNLVESVTGQIDQRPLSQSELNSLRPIYGNSINYGAVTIQTGGIRESLGMTAHVVGNDIFMPEKFFDSNGVLTERGEFVLNHEMGHIWQFQNQGPEYINGALYAQLSEGSGSVGTGEGYDWLVRANEGVHFNDMNPESQAELAAFIGEAIDPETGEVDEDLLEKAIATELRADSYDISPDTLAIVTEAHDILRAG